MANCWSLAHSVTWKLLEPGDQTSRRGSHKPSEQANRVLPWGLEHYTLSFLQSRPPNTPSCPFCSRVRPRVALWGVWRPPPPPGHGHTGLITRRRLHLPGVRGQPRRSCIQRSPQPGRQSLPLQQGDQHGVLIPWGLGPWCSAPWPYPPASGEQGHSWRSAGFRLLWFAVLVPRPRGYHPTELNFPSV